MMLNAGLPAAVPSTPPAREPQAPQPARTIKRKAVNYGLLRQPECGASAKPPAIAIAIVGGCGTAGPAPPPPAGSDQAKPTRAPTPPPAEAAQCNNWACATPESGARARPATPETSSSRRGGTRNPRTPVVDVACEQAESNPASSSVAFAHTSSAPATVSRSASVHSNVSTEGKRKGFFRFAKSSAQAVPPASPGFDACFASPGRDSLPGDQECSSQLAALSERLEEALEKCKEWKRKCLRVEHDKIRTVAELSEKLRSAEEAYRSDVESIKAAHVEKCGEMLHSISGLLAANDSFRRQLESRGIEPAAAGPNEASECHLDLNKHRAFLENAHRSIEQQVAGRQQQLEDVLFSVEATAEAIVGKCVQLFQSLPPDRIKRAK